MPLSVWVAVRGRLFIMFWALFPAVSMMAPCLPVEDFSWGALAGLNGVLSGVCLQCARVALSAWAYWVCDWPHRGQSWVGSAAASGF